MIPKPYRLQPQTLNQFSCINIRRPHQKLEGDNIVRIRPVSVYLPVHVGEPREKIHHHPTDLFQTTKDAELG